MPPCVVFAVPPMDTTDPFRKVICFSTPLFPAVPPIAGADCVKRLMSIVTFRTVPAVFAVRFRLGRMMRFMNGTVPMMGATRLFGVGLSAIDTVPTLCTRTIRSDGVMEVAGNAPPIMGAVIVFLQNFIAGKAIPPTARTDFIRRMTLRANGAIPGTRTGFTDVTNRSTRFVRTIPAVRVCRGTNKICLVSRFTGITHPKMSATLRKFETSVTRFAETVSGVVAIRHIGRMPLNAAVVCRANPIMRAPFVNACVNLQAGITEPSRIVANLIRHMPTVAVFAVPAVRTQSAFGVGFFTGVAPIPILRAGPAFGVGIFTLRAIPRLFAIRLFIGVESLQASFAFVVSDAEPVFVRTNRIKRMAVVTSFAIPAVFAVRFRLGRMVRFITGTVPMMGATCGLGIRGFAIGTVPTVPRTVASRCMVRRADGAIPVVRATFVRRVDLRARFAQTITVNVDIRSGVLHVGRSPIVIAVNVECIAPLTLFAIPVVVARAARSKNTVTLGANPISAPADRVQRVPFPALGAVPKVRTNLTDFVRFPTLRIRTIPLTAANIIFRVMERTVGAIPEMFAVFFRCEDLIAPPTYTITVDVGIRTGVLLLISGAIPGMFAAGI